MEEIKHEEMVKALVKSGADIKEELTASDANAIHMVMGISGEAGELLDAVKKATIYRKPLDLKNVIEELGDLEFYMEGLRQELNIPREDTLTENIRKLGKRYEGFKYSNQAAKDRADKK
jgi:NTP pyrophosphatase (non-canonical NTP hydrolase)